MHPLLFHFGHIAIPTYGVMTAAGLLMALAIGMACARRAGLNTDKVWNLELLAILTTLVASRLLMILWHPQLFHEHPFWVLGMVTAPGTWFALGGVAAGILAAALYGLAEGLPLIRTADALAPAVALAFFANRVGAFFAGLAWGTPTHLPWGVVYRSPVAYLWYRVPLGVNLHPVQLYDAAVSLGLFLLLVWMGRPAREGHVGEVAGTWLFAYGVARFFLEFLRGDPARLPLLGQAVTLAQGLCVIAVVAGGMLWMRREAGAGSREA